MTIILFILYVCCEVGDMCLGKATQGDREWEVIYSKPNGNIGHAEASVLHLNPGYTVQERHISCQNSNSR